MDDKNLDELGCALIKSILEAPGRTAKDVIEPFLCHLGRQALRDRLVALEKRQLIVLDRSQNARTILVRPTRKAKRLMEKSQKSRGGEPNGLE
jgi:DNA-binding MarR family transcriptional regulator